MSASLEHFTLPSKGVEQVLAAETPLKHASYDSILEPYFCPATGKFYEKVNGRFAEKTLESFATSCRAINISIARVNGNTGVALYMKHVEDDRKVDLVGKFAGLKAGLVEIDGLRILVQEDQYLLEPKQGDWSMIDRFVDLFMGAEQRPYFLAWHALMLRSMFAGEWKPNQLLVLAGGANCGKSFWQRQVLTRILGSSQSPYLYMSGQTTFNGELVTAAHLEMADVGSQPSDKQRMDFGNMLKKYTVDRVRSVHPKGRQAYCVPLNQCTSLSVNDKASHLSVLPPLESDISDKVMLFRCGQAALPTNFGLDPDARGTMERLFAEQVPAFLYYLLNEHVIPKDICEERFGVKAYADQGLASSIESVSTGSSANLLELIDVAFFDDPANAEEDHVEKTANEWFVYLNSHEATKDTLRGVLGSNGAVFKLSYLFARIVGLNEVGNERVTKHEGRGRRAYWKVSRARE